MQACIAVFVLCSSFFWQSHTHYVFGIYVYFLDGSVQHDARVVLFQDPRAQGWQGLQAWPYGLLSLLSYFQNNGYLGGESGDTGGTAREDSGGLGTH
jgi:hypothetical protein